MCSLSNDLRFLTTFSHLQGIDTERLYSLITLNYGRHESEALVAWCDETLALLNTMAEKEEVALSTQEGDMIYG